MGALVSQDEYFSWSLNQLAREFGIARETVGSRLRNAHVNPSGERRGHPVYRVGDAAAAILTPPTSEGVKLNDPDLMIPKERSDWYRSENDRVKFEKETGLTASVEDCRMQIAEAVKMGLQVIETLPDILERDFSLPPEVIASVELRLDSLREAWAVALES